MEIRTIRYFLALCREGSISRAASFLHLSQPTLSRQLGELEDELGVLLFKRGKNGIELTEEGLLFRKRCEEISALVEKTENDIKGEKQGGPINVGAGEAVSFSLSAQTFGQLKKRMPLLTLNMVSGDSLSIFEGLRKGLFDFGLVFGDVDSSLYDSFEIPIASEWGICLRADDPLASRESLTKEDLAGRPLILSGQGLDSGLLLHWLGRKKEELDIVATYTSATTPPSWSRRGWATPSPSGSWCGTRNAVWPSSPCLPS